MQLFRNGAHWWPDAEFERKHIAPEQDARYEADAWEDTVTRYLEGRERVSVGEIATDALSFETRRIGTADQRRIAAILERAGWKSARDWKGRCYVRP